MKLTNEPSHFSFKGPSSDYIAAARAAILGKKAIQERIDNVTKEEANIAVKKSATADFTDEKINLIKTDISKKKTQDGGSFFEVIKPANNLEYVLKDIKPSIMARGISEDVIDSSIKSISAQEITKSRKYNELVELILAHLKPNLTNLYRKNQVIDQIREKLETGSHFSDEQRQNMLALAENILDNKLHKGEDIEATNIPQMLANKIATNDNNVQQKEIADIFKSPDVNIPRQQSNPEEMTELLRDQYYEKLHEFDELIRQSSQGEITIEKMQNINSFLDNFDTISREDQEAIYRKYNFMQ